MGLHELREGAQLGSSGRSDVDQGLTDQPVDLVVGDARYGFTYGLSIRWSALRTCPGGLRRNLSGSRALLLLSSWHAQYYSNLSFL